MVAATALGAFAGLFVATYMNAVRKLPIFRQPWEHALMMGAGAYGFNQLEAFEKRVRTPPPLSHFTATVASERGGTRSERICYRVSRRRSRLAPYQHIRRQDTPG
jgi:hypothetical protein